MRRTRNGLGLLVAMVLAAGPVKALETTEHIIRRDQWPEIANSSNISRLSQVRDIMDRFDESGRYRIIVRYPGGDAGAEWAQQLIRWFVAYGVPGEYIGRELGAGGADRLLILLVDNG